MLIAESHRDQRPSDRLSDGHASLASMCSSGATAGDDVGLLIANRGQLALPEEFSITFGGCYERLKNLEFALSNRTIVIWTSKSGGFRENREDWLPLLTPYQQAKFQDNRYM